jgi:hypothetical protein
MGFICRRLARLPLLIMLSGVCLSLLCTAGTVLALWDMQWGAAKRNDLLSVLILGATASVLGLILAGWAAVRVGWVYDHRHRDFRALGRYGPPPEVAAAIDAEVLGGRRQVRLGKLPTFFNPVPEPGELRGHQVILTESWLLDFWRDGFGEAVFHGCGGDRVYVMRPADLVWAAQLEEDNIPRAGLVTLVLLGRHGTGLCINGTEAAVGRLLAEVLARVPWVLGRFEPQAERAGPQGDASALAEVNRRREQFHRGGDQLGAPTTPA